MHPKTTRRSFFHATPKQWIYRSIFVTSICVLIFSVSQILIWVLDNQNVSQLEDELSGIASIVDIPDESTQTGPNDYWDFITTPFLGVSFDALLAKNSDTVGWLQVGGTTVNYPVVQTIDNDFYLTHAFNKTTNAAGWIYADFRCDMKNLGNNTIIYGHERMNATMFGSLKKMLEPSWFDNRENHIIRFATPTKSYVFEVFSVFVIDPENKYITTAFPTEKLWTDFLAEMQGRSIYNFGLSLSKDDKIITLSTCLGLEKRQVVMAKLLKETDL